MRKRLILAGVLAVFAAVGAIAQGEWTYPVSVTDGSANAILTIGINSAGTDGEDPGLDVLAPPQPPVGAFDARFRVTSPPNDFSTDIRSNSSSIKTWVMLYQIGTGPGPIIVSWIPGNLPVGPIFTITDNFNGTFHSQDMRTTSSVNTATAGGGLLASALRVVVDVPLPVQLASFTAHPTQQSTVLLEWSTVSEVNNFGFEVQRKGSSDPSFASLPGVFIPGHGTTIEPHYYSHTDETASAGQWSYRLKQIDYDGTTSFSPVVVVDILTGVGAQEIPTEYYLDQNYPNPFNPSTVIEYGLPERANVSLTVYNSLGQVVATLVQGEQEKGVHTVRLNAANLSSGVYMYTLQAGNFVSTKKLMLVR
ncbi:MAG TPA: T9SS type A sorting domain-containing protein [Bacteroidota bacterium]